MSINLLRVIKENWIAKAVVFGAILIAVSGAIYATASVFSNGTSLVSNTSFAKVDNTGDGGCSGSNCGTPIPNVPTTPTTPTVPVTPTPCSNCGTPIPNVPTTPTVPVTPTPCTNCGTPIPTTPTVPTTPVTPTPCSNCGTPIPNVPTTPVIPTPCSNCGTPIPNVPTTPVIPTVPTTPTQPPVIVQPKPTTPTTPKLTADLALSKSCKDSAGKDCDVSTKKPGDVVTYTITVKNNGTGKSAFTKITDTFDSTKMTSSDFNPAVSLKDGSWSLLYDLNAGETKTITYKGTVKADVTGDVANCARINYSDSTATDAIDKSASMCVKFVSAIPKKADLTLSKTCTDSTGKECDSSDRKASEVVNYKITIKNNGNGPSVATKISDTYDSTKMTLSNFSHTVVEKDGSWSLLYDLSAGETKVITYRGTVKADTIGDVANCARVNYSDSAAADAIDKSASMCAKFKVVASPKLVKSISLALACTKAGVGTDLRGGTVKVGDIITYSFVVTNTGKDTINSVSSVVANLGSDFTTGGVFANTFSSFTKDATINPTTGTITWTNLGSLKVGEQTTVSFSLTVPANVTDGKVVKNTILAQADDVSATDTCEIKISVPKTVPPVVTTKTPPGAPVVRTGGDTGIAAGVLFASAAIGFLFFNSKKTKKSFVQI
jgi:uncharacterized repeat protein (TIGR01451 family)